MTNFMLGLSCGVPLTIAIQYAVGRLVDRMHNRSV